MFGLQTKRKFLNSSNLLVQNGMRLTFCNVLNRVGFPLSAKIKDMENEFSLILDRLLRFVGMGTDDTARTSLNLAH